MSYFATVTFDIQDGEAGDYDLVYREFAKLGLERSVKSTDGNKCSLPSTTTAGTFEAASASALRGDLSTKCNGVFVRNSMRGRIFVAVGGDWAWGHRTP